MALTMAIDLDGAAAQARFHDGDREFLGVVYRETYDVVDAAVGRVLRGADRETVVHDRFLRLLASAELRRGFSGGSLRAWLATLGRNLAVDFWRRYRSLPGKRNRSPCQYACPISTTSRSIPSMRIAVAGSWNRAT